MYCPNLEEMCRAGSLKDRSMACKLGRRHSVAAGRSRRRSICRPHSAADRVLALPGAGALSPVHVLGQASRTHPGPLEDHAARPLQTPVCRDAVARPAANGLTLGWGRSGHRRWSTGVGRAASYWPVRHFDPVVECSSQFGQIVSVWSASRLNALQQTVRRSGERSYRAKRVVQVSGRFGEVDVPRSVLPCNHTMKE